MTQLSMIETKICLHRLTVWNMAGSFSYCTECELGDRDQDVPFVKMGHIMTSSPTTRANRQLILSCGS